MAALRKRTVLSPGVLLAGLVLAGMVAAVFSPVAHHGFVWDDDDYLLANPRLAKGLSIENGSWAFTTFTAANWHPLTWISHLLDVELFGLEPAGHHLMNVLWHIANTLVLFGLFLALTGGAWASAVLAALFAVHPLHVESVAWIAERKDLLSTFWGLCAIAAYVRYARRPAPGRYLLVPGAFLLSLLAKPMLVTLPFVLLLLDYWPLGRAAVPASAAAFFPGPGRTSPRVLIVEKIPLLVMAAASSVVTYLAQSLGNTIRPFSLAARSANAATSYVLYLAQTVRPTRLAVLYPHPREHWSPWPVLGALALLCGATLLALHARRRRPYLIVGWLWYLGMLLPVIGLVQAGTQARADRYTYVPLLGVLVMAVWGIRELRARRAAWRIVRAMTVAIVALLMILSRRQVRHWRDDITLFGHAVAVTADNDLAHYNLGVALQKRGQTADAATNYRKAVAIRPDYAEAHNNLGVILADQGRDGEAVEHYQAALRANPAFAESHNNLGVRLAVRGRTREAVAHYLRAVRIDPEYAEAHFNLGTALARLGKPDAALPHFAAVVRIKPDFPDGRNNLAATLADLGRFDEAVLQFAAALRLNPADAVAHHNLGLALEKQGNREQAVAHFREALRLDPHADAAGANLSRAGAAE